MGLFSRKSSTTDPRPKSRPSISDEAQARELRVRARRRLVGALALVLAVVIVVPMLFDTTTEHPQDNIIVVPMVVTPAVDDPLTQVPDDTGTSGTGVIITENAATPAQQPDPQTASPQPPSVQPPAAATRSPTAHAPSPPPPTPDRTDDGSVAMALLDGHQPDGAVALALLDGRQPASTSPASNRFVLQVAAYASQQDAQARRDQLMRSGITNVRVQTARVNGKDTYRVRVGPFSTREAAQAAQARIRSLGNYQDAFITVQ